LFMEQLRVFVAVELPDNIKGELDSLQEKLKLKRDWGIKTVDAGAMHLTLKFLGNVPSVQVEEIKSALDEAARGITPFSLELKGVGCFPNTRRPRVIWAGLEFKKGTLDDLQKNIDLALEVLGFPPENRPFTAHLTLARVRENCLPGHLRRLGESVAGLDYKPGHVFPIDHFNLMRSILKPQGPEYSVLARIDL
ncbi:MAG: RNA 2',3'-cyclic phosphodiesterase, partial [Dehalococcoidia bacterium]|nr:RNA 2',3'-cyclic phosphodiesterase [Dehalococcoidia bacterium]